MHILSAKLNPFEEQSIEHLADSRERNRRWAENAEQIWILVQQLAQSRRDLQGKARGHPRAIVHLPITGDNRGARRGSRHHRSPHPQRSCRAATPGSTRPSRNSNEAPPPVDTCVILSAAPACSTAAAESPPPTTVVAPRAVQAARISMTALVPRAKAGISATPRVPFQTTVWAFSSTWRKAATVSSPISRIRQPGS